MNSKKSKSLYYAFRLVFVLLLMFSVFKYGNDRGIGWFYAYLAAWGALDVFNILVKSTKAVIKQYVAVSTQREQK